MTTSLKKRKKFLSVNIKMRIVLFQGWSDNGSSWLMIFVVMRMVYDVVGGGVDDGGVFVGLWSRN